MEYTFDTRLSFEGNKHLAEFLGYEWNPNIFKWHSKDVRFCPIVGVHEGFAIVSHRGEQVWVAPKKPLRQVPHQLLSKWSFKNVIFFGGHLFTHLKYCVPPSAFEYLARKGWRLQPPSLPIEMHKYLFTTPYPNQLTSIQQILANESESLNIHGDLGSGKKYHTIWSLIPHILQKKKIVIFAHTLRLHEWAKALREHLNMEYSSYVDIREHYCRIKEDYEVCIIDDAHMCIPQWVKAQQEIHPFFKALSLSPCYSLSLLEVGVNKFIKGAGDTEALGTLSYIPFEPRLGELEHFAGLSKKYTEYLEGYLDYVDAEELNEVTSRAKIRECLYVIKSLRASGYCVSVIEHSLKVIEELSSFLGVELVKAPLGEGNINLVHPATYEAAIPPTHVVVILSFSWEYDQNEVVHNVITQKNKVIYLTKGFSDTSVARKVFYKFEGEVFYTRSDKRWRKAKAVSKSNSVQ